MICKTFDINLNALFPSASWDHSIIWREYNNTVRGSIRTKGLVLPKVFQPKSSEFFFLHFQFILVVATIGTAFGLIALGLYMTLKSLKIEVDTFNFIPVVAFSWSMFITSLGIQSLTLMVCGFVVLCKFHFTHRILFANYQVLVEIMPEKIKDACVSFCMTLLWFFAFVNIKYLPSFIDVLGFHWTMFIFAGICLFGALFTILFIPETKGKSHDEIMKSLQKKF